MIQSRVSWRFRAGRVVLACALIVAAALFFSAPQVASAQSIQILEPFGEYYFDSFYPYGALHFDSQGNLFGTLNAGGTNCNDAGCGAVFELPTPSNNSETVVWTFAGPPTDGSNPGYGPLISDAAGNLYGTTVNGGTYNLGTVFELTQTSGTWEEKILHSFAGQPSDGANPESGLLRDASGNLYGTTEYGGAKNAGTIYRLSAAGKVTIAHSFGGTSDGANPRAGLTLVGGTAYGTTSQGGSHGMGVVFKIQTTGKYGIVYNFAGGTDGATPIAGVIVDAAGNLYGTTEAGGGQGYGTVFEIPAGSTTDQILHAFALSDGAYPYGGLVRDASGNLYGTTTAGGHFSGGTVFEITAAGSFEIFALLTLQVTGASPFSSMILDSSGNLYGTTSNGGQHNGGTAFKVIP